MTSKCDQCQVESDVTESFVRKPVSFSRKTKLYCPSCLAKNQIRTHKFVVFSNYVIYGGVGLFLICTAPKEWAGWVATNFFLFQIASMLVILPHELGHALAARSLGYRVFKIIIGIGKPVWKTKLLGFDVEFNPIPAGGMTISSPLEITNYRRRHFLVVLAGPAVNGVMAIIIFALIPFDDLFNWRQFCTRVAPLPILFFANAWVLVFNLWPFRFSKFEKIPSDGEQLVTLPFLKEEKIHRRHAAGFVLKAAYHHERGEYEEASRGFKEGLSLYPDEPHLLNGHAISLLESGYLEEARNLFLKLLEQTSERIFRAMVMNNIAYTDILMGRPELFGEADRYSQEAMAQLGSLGTIRGTRGAVLIELGRIEEGISFLKQGMKSHLGAKPMAKSACLIAIATARANNSKEAQKYLTEARRLDCNCSFLQRAEEVVANPVLAQEAIFSRHEKKEGP